MSSTSGSRVDWTRSPSYHAYESHSPRYEGHYDYPPPSYSSMMPSRKGSSGPHSVHVPPDAAYWYGGHPSTSHHRRPAHPSTETPWRHHHHHHRHHSMSREYESQYEHNTVPPPSHHHSKSYAYPHGSDLHAPTPGRGGERGAHVSPPSSKSAVRPPPVKPQYSHRTESTVEEGDRSAGDVVSHSHPVYSQSRSDKQESTQNKKCTDKNGDPLSLLAKVSTAIAHDGSTKQRDCMDQQPKPESRPTYPLTPAEQRFPKPREVTPTLAAVPGHANYPAREAQTTEHPYWSEAPPEGDYRCHPRDPHLQYPPEMVPYSGPLPPPRQNSHGHGQHRYPPHNPPPPHYYANPHDSGWGTEVVNETPPPLIEGSSSFEGHETDPHYPYYPPPPPTPPSFDHPYDSSTRGMLPPPPNWKEYPPSSDHHAGRAPASFPPSPWGPVPPARSEEANTTAPNPVPSRHIYPPPRWSYEFGRPHNRNYALPPRAPRMASSSNMEQPSSRGPVRGESSSFSTPPRTSYYRSDRAGDLEQGTPPPPYHSSSHSYHQTSHPHNHPHHAGSSGASAGRGDGRYLESSNTVNHTKNDVVYSPYTYVQKAQHTEEKTILRKKFSWKHYPELEQFLIAQRDEYLRHSSMNYTAEQKQYNNWLTEKLLQVAEEHNYEFDKDDFNFVGIRDRIRCYYKSYVQTARKRGLSLPPSDAGNYSSIDKSSSNNSDCNRQKKLKTSDDRKQLDRGSDRFTSSLTILPGQSFHSCAISIA